MIDVTALAGEKGNDSKPSMSNSIYVFATIVFFFMTKQKLIFCD